MKYLILILLFTQLNFSQETYKGKIITFSKTNPILIANFSNKLSVLAHENGEFEIKAKTGDILIISSKEIECKEIKISTQMLQNKVNNVFVKTKSEELNEVSISKISAKSVGINTFEILLKNYANTRIKQAATHGAGVDINYLIGQGYNLIFAKKIKENRIKSINQKNFSEICSEEYIKDSLHIPLYLVSNFEKTALENPNIIDAINSNNKKVVYFLVKNMAQKYIDNASN